MGGEVRRIVHLDIDLYTLEFQYSLRTRIQHIKVEVNGNKRKDLG